MLGKGGGYGTLALFLLFFAFLPVGAAPKTMEFKSIYGDDDLPPKGTRSLFDYLIQIEPDSTSSLPFNDLNSLRKIIAPLLDREESEFPLFLDALFTTSRSLVRAYAAASVPRPVMGIAEFPKQNEKHFGLLLKDRLFIGYHQSTKSFEVISENPLAGRMEFQVGVYDDKLKKPRFYYGPRKDLCLVCHINANAQFSQGPWSETNANRVNVLAIQKFHPGEEYYQGMLIDQSARPTVHELDKSTNQANLRMGLQTLWVDGCQTPRCRMLSLQFGLELAVTGNLSAEAPEFKELAENLLSQAWKQWPDGLRLPYFDLFDPQLQSNVPTPIATPVDGDLQADNNRPETIERKKLKEMLKKSPLPDYLEPAETPGKPIRAHVDPPEGVFNFPMKWTFQRGSQYLLEQMGDFFTDADIALLSEKVAGNYAKVTAYLHSLPEADPLFARAPLVREKILQRLLVALSPNGYKPPAAFWEDRVPTGEPQLQPEGAAIHSDKLLNDFRVKIVDRYCRTCHGSQPLNFQAMTSDEEILNVLRKKKNAYWIYKRLDWNTPISDEDKKTLEKLGKNFHYMPFPNSGNYNKMAKQEQEAHAKNQLSHREILMKEIENFLRAPSDDDKDPIPTAVSADPFVN